MRTYRLHFSSVSTILQRRLEKAKSAQAERLLVSGLDQPELLKPFFNGSYAVEKQLTEIGGNSVGSEWDEIHYLVHRPTQEFSAEWKTEKSLFVLQPQSLNMEAWVRWLRNFTTTELSQKVYLEFLPWQMEHPHLPTVHEVSSFLHSLKYHFPQWQPKRRPGIELWDQRIPENFELEASFCEQIQLNWNSSDPKISVVIPSYNNKYFVYQALRHLGGQDLAPEEYEVVLVDDGGSDETLNYLKTFGIPGRLQLRYIYWPRPHDRLRGDSFFRAGLSRNLGVRHSRGSQLVFLDSDILVSDRFLSCVEKNLKTSDVLQFPRKHLLQEKSKSQICYKKISTEETYLEEPQYWGPFFQCEDWMKLPFFWKYTCTYALALKKEDFYRAGGFKRFYVSYGFEDTELGYHLAKLGKKFHLVKEPVYHLTSYSQSEYQLSQARRRKLLKRTAKQFFLSTLDLEVYYHLRSFMAGDAAFLPRLKSYFGSRDRTKNHGEVFLRRT